MSITASDVKRLRERTGLPMMDCKTALSEAGGDEDKAIDILRKKGQKVFEKRRDRETSFGRFGLYCGAQGEHGAIVELLCESAPVASQAEFVQLADDLAKQLATGPGAANAEELLDQPSPSNPDRSLRDQKDELFNRIREVFNVGRMKRMDGGTGGYCHNAATVSGVLIGIDGGTDEAARDVSMHIAAMRPEVLSVDDLDEATVEKEREILRQAALEEGKPENIVEKMVEGRLRNFFSDRVLLEQPFVKDEKQTVGQYADSQGMTIREFVHWELGAQSDDS